jgi:hypothetical protein
VAVLRHSWMAVSDPPDRDAPASIRVVGDFGYEAITKDCWQALKFTPDLGAARTSVGRRYSSIVSSVVISVLLRWVR